MHHTDILVEDLADDHGAYVMKKSRSIDDTHERRMKWAELAETNRIDENPEYMSTVPEIRDDLSMTDNVSPRICENKSPPQKSCMHSLFGCFCKTPAHQL